MAFDCYLSVFQQLVKLKEDMPVRHRGILFLDDYLNVLVVLIHSGLWEYKDITVSFVDKQGTHMYTH